MYRIAVGANVHPTDTVGVNVSNGNENQKYSADGLFDKDGILDDMELVEEETSGYMSNRKMLDENYSSG